MPVAGKPNRRSGDTFCDIFGARATTETLLTALNPPRAA